MKFLVPAACAAALSGCIAGNPLPFDAPDPTAGRAFCSDPASPSCRFLNQPVRFDPTPVRLPGREYLFHATREPLEFVDAAGRRWRAPVGTLTDGASIPRAFTAIVGSPTAPEVVNAAVMHDAMCGVGNTGLPGFHTATWEATHRMFYEGLRVGGTADPRAKVMFAAVYLGGPRWRPGDRTFNDPLLGSMGAFVSTQGRGWGASRGLDGQAAGNVPLPVLLGIMQRTKAWIEANDPGIGQIESYIRWQEAQALRTSEPGAPDEEAYREPVFEEPIRELPEDPVENGEDIPADPSDAL